MTGVSSSCSTSPSSHFRMNIFEVLDVPDVPKIFLVDIVHILWLLKFEHITRYFVKRIAGSISRYPGNRVAQCNHMKRSARLQTKFQTLLTKNQLKSPLIN